MEKAAAVRILERRNPALVMRADGLVVAANRGAQDLVDPDIVDRYWLQTLYESRDQFQPQDNKEFWRMNLGIMMSVGDDFKQDRPAIYELAYAFHTSYPFLNRERDKSAKKVKTSPVSIDLGNGGFVRGEVDLLPVLAKGAPLGRLLRFMIWPNGKDIFREGFIGDREFDLSVNGETMPTVTYIKRAPGFPVSWGKNAGFKA